MLISVMNLLTEIFDAALFNIQQDSSRSLRFYTMIYKEDGIYTDDELNEISAYFVL